MSLVESWSGKEESQRQDRSHRSECSAESHARAHTHRFPKLVQLLRARAADDPHHRQPYMEPEFPVIMADYCFRAGRTRQGVVHHPGHALGMMAAVSVEEKCRPQSRRWSNTCEHGDGRR